ncbi:MAG: CBS domain-containing protein [Pelovirga sp.]
MKTIKEVLQTKGSEVFTINEDQTVYTALSQLAEKNLGALVVTNAKGAVVGLLSERDYARKVILKGVFSRDTLVKTIMEKQVYYVRPEDTVESCMSLMTEKRTRHLPVMEDDTLVGLVSIGDLVKATIQDKEVLIGQLKQYIQSG